MGTFLRRSPRGLPSVKGLLSCPRKEDFFFPRTGQVFLIWNSFPILSTGVSWDKNQGSWNPLGFRGPQLPPVQITFVLARAWTLTPDPTGEDRWPALSQQLDPGEQFRNTIIWSCIIPQPHVTSSHQKRVYATTTQTMQQQNSVAKTTTLHES